MLDIVKVCEDLDLRTRELGALIGECHTSISKIERSPCHRPLTNGFYRLLFRFGRDGVNELLDMWVGRPPKNALQVEILVNIARRYKGRGFNVWLRAMQGAHPDFFPATVES